MAGQRGGEDTELLISPALLEHLFGPLQAVLKENGEAIIELSDQLKVVVTVVTSYPTRQDIVSAINAHQEHATKIRESIDKLTTRLWQIMWTAGIIWAAVEVFQSWKLFFK